MAFVSTLHHIKIVILILHVLRSESDSGGAI